MLLPLGHRGEPAGEVGELADVVPRYALVGVGLVAVRGRMVRRADVEERIEQSREVAAKQQRGDPRLVGLERQGDDVAHQPHVLADIFGQAVVGPGHRDGGAPAVLGPVVGPVLHRAGAFDPLLHLADAGEILVQLGPIGVADLTARARRRDPSRGPGCSASACSPGCRRGCRTPATDRPPSAPARARPARRCASYTPSRSWSRGSR